MKALLSDADDEPTRRIKKSGCV